MTAAAPNRRSLLIGGAGLAAAAMARPAFAQAGITDYAVFTEFSPNNKPMKAGWNGRSFTDTDARKGNTIQVAAGDTTDPVDMHAIDNGDPAVLCIGSASNANMTPGLFETFFETAGPANLVLEHQCGSNPEQVYLRVFTQNSKWHAFARISIRRIG